MGIGSPGPSSTSLAFLGGHGHCHPTIAGITSPTHHGKPGYPQAPQSLHLPSSKSQLFSVTFLYQFSLKSRHREYSIFFPHHHCAKVMGTVGSLNVNMSLCLPVSGPPRNWPYSVFPQNNIPLPLSFSRTPGPREALLCSLHLQLRKKLFPQSSGRPASTWPSPTAVGSVRGSPQSLQPAAARTHAVTQPWAGHCPLSLTCLF